MEIETNLEFSPKNFKSRDLYLAAYLLATDHELVETSYDYDGGFYVFEFSDKESCEYQEKLCSMGKTSVNFQRFSESFRYLKKIVSKN